MKRMCPSCGGSGLIPTKRWVDDGVQVTTMDCPRCNGQAMLVTRPDGKLSPFTEREEAWLRFTAWRLKPVTSSEYVW